jgi:hypothetical protein
MARVVAVDDEAELTSPDRPSGAEPTAQPLAPAQPLAIEG